MSQTRNIVKTFGKHAIVAAISVGVFATLIEHWSTSKSAFIYAAQPLGFLYLVITCLLTRGRKETPKFSQAAAKGMIVWGSFILTWWIADRNNVHIIVPFATALCIWAVLFLVILFKWT